MRNLCLLCLFLVALPGEAADCLKDGDTVSLVGKVWRETFPGRPNYQSIEDGDEPETVWALTLPPVGFIVAVESVTAPPCLFMFGPSPRAGGYYDLC